MGHVRKGILLGLLGLFAGGYMTNSTGAEHDSPGCPAFSEFDLDGSGLISEAEFNSVRGQRMAAKAAEGKQMKGAASAPDFADIDTDGDGQLNAEELTEAHKAHMGQGHVMGKGQRHGYGKAEAMGKQSDKGGCKGKGMKANMPRNIMIRPNPFPIRLEM